LTQTFLLLTQILKSLAIDFLFSRDLNRKFILKILDVNDIFQIKSNMWKLGIQTPYYVHPDSSWCFSHASHYIANLSLPTVPYLGSANQKLTDISPKQNH
jgi:hypothetical protein